MKRLLGGVRRAMEDYNMVEAGDSVAVGVSGGKDSLMLLYALAQLRSFYPKPFAVKAITLDLGYGHDYKEIAALCEKLDVEFIVERTQIREIVFDIRKEENPCALCANLRRGALHNAAIAHGCNRVALGHHYDDVIETFMLSLMYEGRVSCFSPVTYLERCGLYMIRPLIYVEENNIRRLAHRFELPVWKNPCIADGNTKRAEVKKTLELMCAGDRDMKKRLFNAVKTSDIQGWKL